MSMQSTMRSVVALAAVLLVAVGAQAQTTTWTGNENTDWNTSGNWSHGVPGNGDNVVVPNTTTKPTMPAGTYPATGRFGSFEVQDGATITCLGDTSVTNEASGGGIGGDGKIHGIGVTILCASAEIDGTLNADSQGFPQYQGPGKSNNNPSSHGGRAVMAVYGDPTAPTALGSGGDGGNGGPGGGAIKIDATGTVRVDGLITANAPGRHRHTGSGGSIWIDCETLAGGGTIRAEGGHGEIQSGGAGGRVALTYTTSSFSGSASVAGGVRGMSADPRSVAAGGQPGTLWEPNRFAGLAGSAGSPEDVLISDSYQYIWPDAATTNYWNLTVSNAWVEMRGGALVVADLVVHDDAVFRADDLVNNNPRTAVMEHLALTNSIHLIGASWVSSDNRNPVMGGGRLFLTAGTNTLAGALTIEAGSFLTAMGDTSVTNEASGGGIGGDGKIHGLGLTIECADAFIYGTLTADLWGFPVGQGPGYTFERPSSHGGRGVSAVYGNASAPTALGSGGTGGAGGGAIKIAASGGIHVDGLISANAQNAHRYSPSGGSIWLVSDTLTGSGIIRAQGGNGEIQVGAAGGRIALDYTTSTFSGRVSAAGGRSGYAAVGDVLSVAAGGQPGTLWEPNRYAGRTGTLEAPATVRETDSFQYLWPDAATTNYWNLTVSNAWVELQNGALVVGSLVVQEDAVLLPAMPHFDLTGTVTVSGLSWLPIDSRTPSPLGGGRFHLPAGYYELDELTVATGSFLYARGDTTVTNEASGGGIAGDGKIHGIGPTVRAAAAVIDGTVSAVGLGFARNQGPGSKISGSFGGSYGGAGNTGGPVYGQLTRPTALGSGGSESAGASAFRLDVNGTLALNGTINASAPAAQRTGSGGSLWITARTLTGSGSVTAAGADHATNPSGGGRIALGYVDGTGWTGTKSVWGRTANSAQYGTIFECASVDFDAAIEGNNVGADLKTALLPSANGVRVSRQITTWQPAGSLVWTDAARDALDQPLAVTADYGLTGLLANMDYYVFTNGVNVLGDGIVTNSGDEAALDFTVALDGAIEMEVRCAIPVYLAQIGVTAPSSVSTTGALFNGWLTDAGTTPTRVYAFRGQSDPGKTLLGWDEAIDMGEFDEAGPVSGCVAVPTGQQCYYRLAASNVAGWAWSDTASYFLTAGITADVEPAIIGESYETATFRLMRPAGTDGRAVTVYYAVGGTAEPGSDYTAIADTQATIPAGATSVTFTVTSILDAYDEGDATVTVTILPDPEVYPVGIPGVATLTITNTPLPIGNATVAAGSWTNPVVWSAGVVPVVGQDVTLRHAVNVPAGIWPPLGGRYGTLVVSNGVTVTCAGDPTVINEASGGYSIPLPGGGTETVRHGIGVTFRCLDAVIDGTLSADAQGFPRYGGPGHGGSTGRASHGGRAGGVTYGRADQPTALGSGGGDNGGAGGGAIRIDATGTIRVDGTLTANANEAHRHSAAGGSIWLSCDTLAGGGVIRAEGGAGQIQAGAGGGRIALDYTAKTFTGRVSVAGGRTGLAANGDPMSVAVGGQPGTLWEPKRFAGRAGSVAAPENVTVTESGQYVWPDADVTHYWNLTVTDAWFEVRGGALVVSNLVVRDDAVFRADDGAGGNAGVSAMERMEVTGSILVSGASQAPYDSRTPGPLGGGRLFLLAGEYDLDALTVGEGSFLYPQDDRTAVNAASGGQVGKPHGVGVTIRSRTALIEGTVNGVGRGFRAWQGPGAASSGHFGGAHGGAGTLSGPVYGRLTRPTALGSGGSIGAGGGAFRLEVRGALAVNGTIDMSGTGWQRTGAGGSIWLAAETLTGAGTLKADGDPTDSNTEAGGGGRIAVCYVNGSGWTGTNSVWARTDKNAQYGTIFECASVDLDAVIEANTSGVALDTSLAMTAGGIRLVRTITRWNPDGTIQWSDTCYSAVTGEAIHNTATYTVSGLTPNGYARAFVNNQAVEGIAAATAEGTLSITGVTLDASAIVRVDLAPAGTLMLLR